jgi:hypothetical protein
MEVYIESFLKGRLLVERLANRTKRSMKPRTNELRVKAESRNAGGGGSDQLEA